MDTMKFWLLAAVCVCTTLGMVGFSGIASCESGESFALKPVTFDESGMQISPIKENHLWVAAGEAAAPVSDTGVVPAAEEEAALEPSKPLTITIKGDWVSKYMFRGADVLDDRGAYQPSVDIGLDCGLHFHDFY